MAGMGSQITLHVRNLQIETSRTKKQTTFLLECFFQVFSFFLKIMLEIWGAAYTQVFTVCPRILCSGR